MPKVGRDAKIHSEFSRIEALPVFPAVAVKVLEIRNRPDHSSAEIADCVRRDTALTTRVLALANSALFAPRRPIATLPHAIAFVGEAAVTAAVVAAAMERMLGQPGKPLGEPERVLWRHSLLVAAFARRMARRRGLDGDEALVIGLLHDIGLLQLRSRPAESLEELRRARADGRSPRAAEALVFGAHHADVGAAMLVTLGVPEDVAHAVSLHHGPQANAPASVADCVHVGDWLAAEMGFVPEEEAPASAPREYVLQRLAIRGSHIQDERDAVEVEIADVERRLGAALPSA